MQEVFFLSWIDGPPVFFWGGEGGIQKSKLGGMKDLEEFELCLSLCILSIYKSCWVLLQLGCEYLALRKKGYLILKY